MAFVIRLRVRQLVYDPMQRLTQHIRTDSVDNEPITCRHAHLQHALRYVLKREELAVLLPFLHLRIGGARLEHAKQRRPSIDTVGVLVVLN